MKYLHRNKIIFQLLILQPVPVAVPSKALVILDLSKIETMSSNTARGMDYVRVFLL
jgi:hypothetical protein